MMLLRSHRVAAWACAGVIGAALSPGAVVGAFGAPVATETVVEVRIHGNNSVPDEEVLKLAGIALGDFVDNAELDAVARRLAASGRFETVEVHKRYRSLTATDRIALVIVVRERPPRLDRLMFLPILRYEEGYGVTYGLGFSLVDVPGQGGRLSVPMTWGADRRTAFEVERPFGNEAVGRLRGGGSSGRRMHPHFMVEDRRSRVWGGVERRLAFGVRAGAEVEREEVVFGELADRLMRTIVSLEYDSLSSTFPRNDVKLSVAVERLSVAGHPAAVLRPRVDAQAFKGVGGQAVLAARVLYEGASGPLPPYERALLGGVGTLRGWEFGAQVGDRLLAASIELRLPLSSPLATGKTGFLLFYDTAAALLRHGCSVERRIRARPANEGCRRRCVSEPAGGRERAVRRRPRLAGRCGGTQHDRLRLLRVDPWDTGSARRRSG